jgi:hypothetical protein
MNKRNVNSFKHLYGTANQSLTGEIPDQTSAIFCVVKAIDVATFASFLSKCLTLRKERGRTLEIAGTRSELSRTIKVINVYY